MITNNSIRRFHLGVTLMEVIFAMGVVLVGILGVVAVLPLAGNRASEAVNLNTAAMFSDATAKYIVSQTEVSNTINIDHFVASDASLGSIDAGTHIAPFCIDPLMSTSETLGDYAAFQSGWFPFFRNDYDPLVNPSSTNSAPAISGTPSFLDQPRLLRAMPAGLSSIADAAARREFARLVSENPDDVNSVLSKDRSLPAVVGALQGTDGGIRRGVVIPTGQFSWIATVDPFEDTRVASMSVVVFHGRDQGVSFPSEEEDQPRNNPRAERLAVVAPGSATGFRGGSGGQLTLLGSASVVSGVKAGDWIMLSVDTVPTAASTRNHVHRWYRVVSALKEAREFAPDSDTAVGGFTVPASPSGVNREDTKVWEREVILDGSDWGFGGDTFTYATLCDGVVAVAERVVTLSETP